MITKLKSLVFCAVILTLVQIASLTQAQDQPKSQSTQAPPTEKKPSDEGIPVTSELVRAACGSCHKTDEKNCIAGAKLEGH
jgi:cytochrome c553